MVSADKIGILQADQRLDVPGLRKHVERLHDFEAVALGYQELQIPRERRGVAGKIPHVGDAGVADSAERYLVAAFARRVQKEDLRIAQGGSYLRRPDRLLDSARNERDAFLQSVEPRVYDRLGDRVRVLFDADDAPAVLREIQRKRSDAAVEVDEPPRTRKVRLEEFRRSFRPFRD